VFLSTGVSGAIGPTGGVYEYETSQDGGTENTVAEGVDSGAGAYAGPNMALTRPLTDYYTPQSIIAPINTTASVAVPQGQNPYTNNGPIPSPTGPMATTTGDCGCGGECGKLPWWVLVGVVIGVAFLLRGK